jgi:NADPH-dependent curcumin reductase CurA
MANEQTNRKVILHSRPQGYPTGDNFKIIETDIPVPGEGEVLVRTLWLSVDPYMRGRISDAPSYTPPLPVGQTMPGGTVGKVVVSRNDRFPVGTFVEVAAGWQDYLVSSGRNLRVLDEKSAPLSTAVGVLGMPGLTAYHGLFEIGKPQPGETLVVSGASGAVGAIVGQLGKLAGCTVVGIAGSDEKAHYLAQELGFDGVINYKTENVETAIQQHCPGGVDMYFDNVGGNITDIVIKNLAFRARMIICGQISQYNLEEPELGPRNLGQLIVHQASVEGFIVGRFADRAEVARARLTQLVKQGKIVYREDVVDGLENAPDAFMGLFEGKNFGKMLIKVSSENE